MSGDRRAGAAPAAGYASRHCRAGDEARHSDTGKAAFFDLLHQGASPNKIRVQSRRAATYHGQVPRLTWDAHAAAPLDVVDPESFDQQIEEFLAHELAAAREHLAEQEAQVQDQQQHLAARQGRRQSGHFQPGGHASAATGAYGPGGEQAEAEAEAGWPDAQPSSPHSPTIARLERNAHQIQRALAQLQGMQHLIAQQQQLEARRGQLAQPEEQAGEAQPQPQPAPQQQAAAQPQPGKPLRALATPTRPIQSHPIRVSVGSRAPCALCPAPCATATATGAACAGPASQQLMP
jgi:hypothetical protein